MKARIVSNNRTVTLGVAATGAAVLAAIGAAAAVASPAAASHTLRFTSVQTGQQQFAGHHFAGDDKDVSNGKVTKVVGYDVVHGDFDAKARTFTVDIAVSLRGGIIEGHGTGSATTGKFTGVIDGGTGAYKGIHGTMKGQSTGKHGDDEKLVLTYHH